MADSAASASRFLHVANGTSTTGTIQAAGIPGVVSIWADPLYEGPVPAGLTDSELIAVRSRYLAGAVGHEDVDPVHDLRNWRAVIDRVESYDELILWFEHDLFDQLNLIQLLAWIRTRPLSGKAVSLICISSFPGHPRFKGLGELAPTELATLLGSRRPVSEPQYLLAQSAWDAFRQPTPQALERLRHADTSALPYLSAAIARFLQELPWTTDGLSRSERRLLELASAGTIKLSAAFPRMHAGEDAYYVTDLSLAAMAEALSRTSPPLLTLDARPDAASNPLQASVTLTDAGRAVLAGKQDRITTCGIDRWMGGVHLQNDAPLWRWDDDKRRIAS